ncbi:DUF7408 domain-containing protein [Cohnella faecalis]|uniref:DUF7408 domain-containing protein n=1 Tax=Cohnella faecalis TaxID=2315694 RepID=A0A398D059_9BACL|nr:hypothetical protein [Cohnella faecalis]RIE04851.1 hypothetical protein D3H35_05130 [Cohnella faecalis]
MKEGKWTRLRTTVTNLTDRDLKGELSITVVLPNGGYNQRYAVPAELPKGSPIEIEITVPGMSYNKQNNRIAFTDSSGKDVPVAIGKEYVEASSIGMSTVGVVARDPDTLNFLPILNQKGYNLKMVPIAEKDIPNTLQLLEGLDILLLNDVATADWTDLRKNALRSWVQQGGTLIVAGGAGYAKTAEGLGDLVPVAAEGTTKLDATKGLEQWGDGKPLAAGYPVTVSTGKLQAGNATAVSDGTIVAAERDYGKGKVAYAAFDPSLEPFVSWTGSPVFWSHFLSGSVNPYSQTGIPGFGSNNENWEISNALNQFPSIKTPSYSLLLIFFIAYLLIVAPGLFLLLRKLDRREWAWWIIPIVSIVSSVVIFTIGSSDKNSTLTHSLRTMELSGTGEAVRSASVAVFVPRGGDVTATFDAGAIALPYQSDGSGSTGNVLTNSTEQAIRLLPGNTEVEWKDVPYWSIRKTWMQYSSASSGHGQFNVALNKQAATYEVDVRNDTEADLTSVALLLSGNVYPIGDLKKGESGKVVVPITRPVQVSFYSDYGNQLFQQNVRNGQDRYARERGLLNGYMNQLANKGSLTKPVIVGYSNDKTGWFEVNGKKAKSDNLTLWVQSFELNDPNGNASGDILPGRYSRSLRIRRCKASATNRARGGWICTTAAWSSNMPSLKPQSQTEKIPVPGKCPFTRMNP